MHPRALSAGDLLVAYEQLSLQPAWRWPAVLLSLGYARLSFEDAVTLPLPWREGLLLRLRRANFGGEMRGHSHCQGCGSDNEISLACDELLTAFPATDALPAEAGVTAALPSGAEARLQGLSSLDLADAAKLPAEAAALLLQERSLKSLAKDGEARSWQQLDARDQAALSQALENLSGGLRLEVICPACESRENREIDLGLWLAQEVSRAAHGLLREVDALARAYGWSENDILNLSPARRRLYLEMVA